MHLEQPGPCQSAVLSRLRLVTGAGNLKPGAEPTDSDTDSEDAACDLKREIGRYGA